jgi:predicted nuclease of predicted toxin-antitoxin system
MRVLPDEGIPVRLAAELPKHDVQTIRGMGWRGKKNGELLQLAASKFNVFVTIDKGLEYQQRTAHLRLGIVTLVAPSNDIDVLRPLMPGFRHG